MTTAARVKKARAYAEHLLDGFLSLRQKYALLDPLLFDKEVVDIHGSGKRAAGFKALRTTLFMDCIQDIAKLSLDHYPTSVSLYRVFATIDDPKVVAQLRDEYYVSGRADPTDDAPEIARLVEESERTYRQTQLLQFDQHHAKALSDWAIFSCDPRLERLKTTRNKVSAHRDLIQAADGAYKLLDIGDLGVKWNDPRDLIAEMQIHVAAIGRFVRGADFAWDHFDTIVKKTADGFWR
jgi:hypothetical protein